MLVVEFIRLEIKDTLELLSRQKMWTYFKRRYSEEASGENNRDLHRLLKITPIK